MKIFLTEVLKDNKMLVGPYIQAEDIEEAIEFALLIGPAGEVLREAKEHLTNIKEELIRTEMRSYFESGEKDLDGIWQPMSAWAITASNPT